MKKLLFAIVLSSLILPQVVFADFTDTANHKNSIAINSLVEQQILQGYEDNSFKPDQEVNRAEAIKIILLGLGVAVDENANFENNFTDVSISDWFFKYIATGVNLGIIKGYDDGTFKAGQTVNRAEALKMLTLAGLVELGIPAENPFPDVPRDSWFGYYADYAKTWNIEPAQTDGNWHGEQNITRGNIAEMVYRMQQVKSSGKAFDESANWVVKNFSTVGLSLKVPYGWYYKSDGVGAIWLLDSAHSQYSLLDTYENGATLLMTRYSNLEGKSAGQLFASLQSNVGESTSETAINGYSALVVYRNEEEKWREWYIVLPNNSMVHLVAMRGQGLYGSYLESYLEKIVMSASYESSGEDAVELIRSAIQVDGQGQNAMALLSDLQLIETDSIGVGTGPVDYYYSPSADITIKYERSYDVILDVKDGNTTAF